MRKPRSSLLAAIAALFLAALACNFSASTANIAESYIASDEQGTQRTNLFAPDDTIYAIVQVKNAPDDTLLKAVWTGIELVSGEKNTSLGEKELTTGSGQAYFNLTGTKPAGKYKVDIYLNGELASSLDFEVRAIQAAAPTVPPPPTEQSPVSASSLISSAYLARDEDGHEVVQSFFPNDTFYAIIEMPDVPPDTVVRAVWYAVEVEGLSLNSMLDQAEARGSGTFTFNLTRTKPWPPGKYKVEIYVNEQLAKNLDFEVVPGEAIPPSGPATGIIHNAYLSLDEAGMQPSTVFGPSDTIYAIVEMPDAPADTTTKAVWYLVEAQGYQPNSLIDQVETTGNDVLNFNLTPTSPFPVGRYKVELYVSGELALILEFEIQ